MSPTPQHSIALFSKTLSDGTKLKLNVTDRTTLKLSDDPSKEKNPMQDAIDKLKKEEQEKREEELYKIRRAYISYNAYMHSSLYHIPRTSYYYPSLGYYPSTRYYVPYYI